MSKMSELSIDIQEMLEDGVHPTAIAKRLSVPLGLVYDTLESMEDEESNTEVFSPFETMNS
jgi:hypothetical protein